MRAVVGVLFVLMAATASAQTSGLQTLERLRPGYPTPMSSEQIGELLNHVAWEHRADGWGLLKKTGGHRCRAPQGIEISCDILIHGPSMHHFDVLSDVDGAAIPTWRNVGPCVLGPSSGCDMANFLAPVTPGIVDPPPPPPPPPPPDPTLALRITALEQTLTALRIWQEQALAAQYQAILQVVEAVATLSTATQAEIQTLRAELLAISCRAALRLGVTTIPLSCTIEGRTPRP